MSLRHSYTLFAPIYDPLIKRITTPLRRDSLKQLTNSQGQQILLTGFGTGLDIPYLSPGNHYTGIDLTAAMLQRAALRRATRDDISLIQGNAMALPCTDAVFDAVVLHLILAVVPQPENVLAESSRVLKPGGKILIVDKFLRPKSLAPVRRSLSPLLGRLATRTDVVFETLLQQHPELRLLEDTPVLAKGWFRRIVLQKEK